MMQGAAPAMVPPFSIAGTAGKAMRRALMARCCGLLIAASPPPAAHSEMTRLFDADQADRAHRPIDWTKVDPRDRDRRSRTRALLATGALRTGADFEPAAFVFQHGALPADFLPAHTLAMVAVAKGRPSANWIAAATLDRYQQTIGQKQVYGTQYRIDGPVTQEPYDRTLISDALRVALGVPTLTRQPADRHG